MRISEVGLSLIKKFESCHLTAYKCPAGVWTVGWGHTRTATKNSSVTYREATELLSQDVQFVEIAINRLELFLNQNQFDALVSFVFNVGTGNFANSTLLKKALQNPDDPGIRDEFTRWVFAKGQRLPGLERRRQAEAELYFTPCVVR